MDPRLAALSSKLKIGAPCPMKWTEMTGDDRIRLCKACDRNVYNVAALRIDEVEALVNEGERTCMLMYRRRDGTLVTFDCSRVWRERKTAAQSLLLTEGLSVLGFLFVLAFVAVCVVTLFGDNLRRHFGAEAGGISVTPSTTPPPSASVQKKSMRDFKAQNTY